MLTQVRARLSDEAIVGTVFVSAMFMSAMDVTVVNVAIPTMARDFHASNASIQWVVVGYLLSLAVWIPASGWMGDRFGTRRVLLSAIGIFTLASALCATAWSEPVLVASRVLQGVGGGMLQPVGMAMLFRAFPPHRRARASQILIVPTAVAPAIGPIIGGLLVEYASWRWVFLINLPIGLAAVTFGSLFLQEHRHDSPGRFDLPGFLLAGIGLPSLLYCFTQGANTGWTSGAVLAAGVAGTTLLSVFVVVELRTAEPMLDLRLLTDRLFRSCNLVIVFAFAGFLGTLFIIPLYLQEARGISALNSGLSTFPEAVGVMAGTQIAGRLYGRIGPRRLMVFGLLVVSLAVTSMSTLGGTTSLWVVRGMMFAAGFGMAYVIIPQQASSFATISPPDMGRAAAIVATLRQTSAATGVAVLATVLSTNAAHGRLPVAGDFHSVFLVAAALALTGAVMALRIRDEDAEATMRGRAISAVAGRGGRARGPVAIVPPPAVEP